MNGVTRVHILGCPCDVISFEEAVASIRRAVLESEQVHIATASVDFVMKARRNAAFAADLRQADLVTADGKPLVWAASLLGSPVRGRVNGTDLVWRCAEISAETNCTVALIGGRFELAREAAARMQARYPRARIVPIATPFPPGENDDRALVERIREAGAKIVLVALGAPRQERWIRSNLAASRACVGIGIGGSFDIIAGRYRRAPRWMQAAGLEWLFRMGQDPKRLAKRYLIEDSPFLWLLLREIVRASSDRFTRKRRTAV